MRNMNSLIKDPQERHDAELKFKRYGTGTILLSRAIPILPEVSACMAGLTSMGRARFFIAWIIARFLMQLSQAMPGRSAPCQIRALQYSRQSL